MRNKLAELGWGGGIEGDKDRLGQTHVRTQKQKHMVQDVNKIVRAIHDSNKTHLNNRTD